MNISTLAKILGVSIKDLRDIGQKERIFGFSGRNTRIPYNSAVEITKKIKPEKATDLQNDDKIYIPPTIKVADLAEAISRASGVVVKSLLMNGVMATLNEKIDFDTASLISEELGVTIYPEDDSLYSKETQDTNLIHNIEYDGPEENKKFKTRPPIVTVMGHVDHGKTTLLDFIRKSNVVSGEAGAITQHISSYKVSSGGKEVTFVDTPGHEAFTAMRARGSQMADFIILMVSATEGPKPQTVEVIERAKLSKVPVIVAINKIDLPNSDPEKAKTEISKYGLVPEEWGGETPFIPISAKTGAGVDKLIETILLMAEVADLKGQIDCPGQAIVIESNVDRSMGVVSTVLVTKDKIKVGNIIRCGEYVGKVRKLENSDGKIIQEAGIGDPVLLVGLPEVVSIGEAVLVYESLRQAQADATLEKNKKANRRIINFTRNSVLVGEQQINLTLKADVAGSLEALKEAIIKIPQEYAKINIIGESVGQLSETDVEYAETTKSTILAFHTKITPASEKLIKKLEVNIVASDIIYEILEWVESEEMKYVKHEIKIEVTGKAKILAVFTSEKANIQIAGGEVVDGKIVDNQTIQIYREDKLLATAEVSQLQRNKDKVTAANMSQQFGISLATRTKLKIGDVIQSIEERIVK